ncbi:hypothetical protein C8Q80DRAFT_591190 [Daedaleopsis nitida]|nr:hypothetical protein C8Q80DRAFT_591190 [Daedaleopsis nitida]
MSCHTQNPHSPELAMEERNETKRTAMEDLVSEALLSPVSESLCPQASSPAQFYVPSPQTTCASFTLVHEQSTSCKHNSSDCDPEPMLDTSAHPNYFPTEDDYELYERSASAGPAPANFDGGREQDDYMQHVDVPNLCPVPSDLELPEPMYTHVEDASISHPLPGSMQVSDSMTSTNLQESSLSSYSIDSGKPDTSGTHPLVSHSTRSLARRATEGSFTSFNLPQTRARRFATRRQAIYAENGIQLAFPESDSESSLRQNNAPPGLARPFTSSGSLSTSWSKGGKGHPARSASEHAFAPAAPRSAWSASTSGASLQSVIDAYTAPDADDVASAPPCLSDPIVLVPRPTATLDLAQANDKLAGFSARAELEDDAVDQTHNPLMDNDDLLTTSTPAQKRPPQQRSRARSVSSARHDAPHLGSSAAESKLELELVFKFPGPRGRTRAPVQWKPLGINKRDSTDPLVLCVPISPRDRAERLELWMEDPDHHPIMEEMLRQVEMAMKEWKQPVGRIVPVVPLLYI